MSSTKLEAVALNKSYGSNHALKNMSYTFTEGVYGLLGPNGAGKSTLMNILTDNLWPDQGHVMYNGKRIDQLGKHYLKVLGYMPQQQALYDGLTAARFLYYMATLKGMSKAEAKEQIPRLFKLVNLQEAMNKKLGHFSGGMKQRVLIAQALLGDPKVLILDEPTAGLDPKERIRIRNLISKISFNKIVLIATHVVSDIEFIAKEIMLLRQGELVDYGKPHQLTDKLQGKVYEIKTDQAQLMPIAQQFKVGNIAKDAEHVYVRIVSERPPENYQFTVVKPTLEDVYLHIFDAEEV